jgi:hypothetical protein
MKSDSVPNARNQKGEEESGAGSSLPFFFGGDLRVGDTAFRITLRPSIIRFPPL